jgi:lysophospholipase L1-like esterase
MARYCSRHSRGWGSVGYWRHSQLVLALVAVMLFFLGLQPGSAVPHRAAVSSHVHCPAALAASRINKGFFSYPEDIYGDRAAGLRDGATPVLNCSAWDTWNQGQHQCPKQLADGHCPITGELIKVFMRIDGSRTRSGESNVRLCSFLESARSPKGLTSPKVVVFGGSETNGAETRGCCCCHPSCPASPFEQPKYCRWSHYLSLALRQRLHTNIDVVNLAHGGWNSVIIAENIRNSLEASNTTLQSNDLVILEPSVNDCASFDNQIQWVRDLTGTGMERAIRNIRTISKVTPAFLLLEVYPLSRVRNQIYNYSTYYRSIARHYNATSWSFTDVASSLLNNNPSNPMAKALNYQLNRPGIPTNHPPWHVHLYLADLIVSALLKTEGFCREASMIQARSEADEHLPQYLYPSKTPVCDESVPPILDASAVGYRPEMASYSVTMSESWKLREDKVGKPGWIIDNTHDEIAATKNSITFSVGQREQLIGNAIIVAVTYLTTYENCGLVKLRICDQLTAEIDSTLPSWETRNISVDAVRYFYLNTTVCLGVSFEQILATKSMKHRKREKFKITAVKICRQEQ